MPIPYPTMERPPTIEDDLRDIVPGASNAEILGWHRDRITYESNNYEHMYGSRVTKYKVEYTLYVSLMPGPLAVQEIEVEKLKVIEPESLNKQIFQEYD